MINLNLTSEERATTSQLLLDDTFEAPDFLKIYITLFIKEKSELYYIILIPLI